MIRRVLLTSAAVLSFALVAPFAANAQTLFISAGGAFPTGDDLDGVNTGLMAAGGVTFDVGGNGVWAGVEGAYARHGTDFVEDGDVTAKTYSVMGILGYSFETAGSVDPYVWAGAGLAGAKISDDSESFSASGFGWQAGAGVSFGGEEAKARPYVEGRYHSGSMEFEGDTSNTTISFFAALVGVAIGVGN